MKRVVFLEEAMEYGYYNGRFDELKNINIPLTDRSIFFGDGVYDAAIGRNGRIHLEDEHLSRFIKNAELIDIDLDYSMAELKRLTREVVKRSGEECFFLYYHISRASDTRRHAYRNGEGSNLLITAKPVEMPNPKKKLKLVTYEDKRYRYCNIKTLNLLPSVLASGYAAALGADEAVFHRNNTVTECAHSNISIIKGGMLCTHPTDEYILAGTARARLLEKCTEMKIPISLRPFTLDMLYTADEVLVTSSSKLCQLAESTNGVGYKSDEGSIGYKLSMALYRDFIAATDRR